MKIQMFCCEILTSDLSHVPRVILVSPALKLLLPRAAGFPWLVLRPSLRMCCVYLLHAFDY